MLKTRLMLFVGLAASFALAAPDSKPGSLHVRGTVKALQGGVLTVQTAKGPVRVQFSAKTPVLTVVPADRSKIKDGSFLGIASVPGPYGTQVAREVLVFPEAARGSGEGSYPWDLPGTGGKSPRSKMTNGTARIATKGGGSRMTNGTVRSSGGGTTLTLEFKQGTGMGSQKIRLTPDIPVVTFVPGQAAQLKPGAHVVVFAHSAAGGATVADRALVGKGSLVPPM